MTAVRRSSHEQGLRINFIAPNYIKSAIRSPEYEQYLLDNGVLFGEAADVATCMERIATDTSINGEPMIRDEAISRLASNTFHQASH
jgi:hypothetical protein